MQAQITIRTKIGSDISFPALLATGGHYCILSRDAADAAESLLATDLGRIALQTARGRIQGNLYLMRIEIFAELGEDLDLEVVALVASDWQGPSIIGYSGALDRFRFAVDPQNNRFLFACFR